MPRRPRNSSAGVVYHVLNRGVARLGLFEKEEDYRAFLRVISDTQAKIPIRILTFCVMPNHWHLVLWPQKDHELSDFMHLLTLTHTKRWHAHYETSGAGPIYQGRFKAFPVQTNKHFLTVAKYVERNPLRAKLCSRAEYWKWSGLALRERGSKRYDIALAKWPVPIPKDWTELVNKDETNEELNALRNSVKRDCPFGNYQWRLGAAEKLGTMSSLRPIGRPAKN